MEHRVENKYMVSDADLAVLAGRLNSIMHADAHQKGDCYEIRSLYFDDYWDSCMEENESGIDLRKKYRIRTYGSEAKVIHLEIKEKIRGLTKKTACDLSRQEHAQILEGALPLDFDRRKPLNQLKLQMRTCGMQPKAIIVYERSAYVCATGNVRITFDRNIMASKYTDELFDEQISGLVPVLPAGMHVLEVKYDEFLPDYIAEVLELGNLRQTAFSKYYLGRLAIEGDFLPE